MCYHVDIKMFIQITLLLLVCQVSLANYLITSDTTATLVLSSIMFIIYLIMILVLYKKKDIWL